MPTAWAAGLLHDPRMFALSRLLPRIPDWEPFTDLRVEIPLAVSYLADWLRNVYSSVWLVAYSEYYCN